MDRIRRQLLDESRYNIIQDLDVSHILPVLIAEKAVNSDQANYINNMQLRSERTSTLLDMLPKNGNDAYDTFVKSLEEWYPWLSNKLKVPENYAIPKKVAENTFQDSLAIGDVPRLPINYVIRTELENDITNHLTALKRHQMVVLYGMAGCGKSSLAVSVLRSNISLVMTSFKGYVFWINVGDCFTDEQIVALQSKIYKKICMSDFYDNNSSLDAISEISFNTSAASARTYEQGWTDYRDMLKRTFEDERLKESLLIIDDLRLDRVAQAFDIGCKLLVTTQDKGFLSEFHPIIVNVSESLTENESLELISNCVGKDVNQLPIQARKIHALCKGAPLLMALIGGLMEENKKRLECDDNYWNYYVKQLKNKDKKFFFSLFGNSSNQQKPYLAITMCVESLKDKEIVTAFKSLAVLPSNVKVPTKALATILDMPEDKVEEIMKKLKNKSLVIEYFDEYLKCYLYEVHDLIMSYLKSIYNENEMKSLHISLINRYREKCLENNLINLPDDGYIAYYIGFHLEHSDNNHHIFNELYTDLTFIGNKIRLAGPADVKNDFVKFSKYIIKRASDNELLSELTKFIHSHAYDLHRYPNTDIIQSIFQHVQKGLLYEKAMSVALNPNHSKYLYFKFQSENSSEEMNYIPLDVRDAICVVKFWMDNILIGNTSGKVIMWNLSLNRKVRTFHGHEGAIKNISLDYKALCKMATIAEDGLLKIWNIRDEMDVVDDADIESIGFDDPPEDTFDSIHTVQCPQQAFGGSYWGHVSDVILAHTHPGGALLLYSSAGECQREMKNIDHYIVSTSILSLDDTLAICGYVNNKSATTKYGIHVYNTKNGDFVMSFSESEYVLSLALIKDYPKCVLSLTKIHLNRHTWKHSSPTTMSQARSLSQTRVADVEVLKAEYTFQTGCVSADGLYMFVSTTDGHVLVYSLQSNEMVLELNNHRGKVTSIDSIGHWDHLEPTHLYSLITKSGEDVHALKFWYLLSSQLKPPSDGHGKAKLSVKFDCVFDKHFLNSPVVTDYHYAEYSGSPVKRTETLDRASMESANNNASNKTIVHKSLSLDRHSIRPLNLKNISTMDIPCHPIIAVVDKKNKVQVLKGKKCVIETPQTKSSITTVALSHCGQYVTYGTKEGIVNLLFLKSRSPKKIMDFNDEIHYLEFINDNLLVAASRSGGLMIYEMMGLEESFAKMVVRSGVELGSQELINDFSGKRSKHPSDASERTKQPSPSPPMSYVNSTECNGNGIHRTYPSTECNLLRQTVFLKCFWIEDTGLLSVACDGSVKRWNLEPRVLDIVIRKQTNFSVSCAALYKRIFLVLCDESGKFQINSLVFDTHDKLSGVLFDTNKVKSGISCCAISNDGKLLALGQNSGEIILWHISKKAIITELALHKSKVRSLKFSPGPPLVSDNVLPNSPFASKSFVFPPVNTPTSPVQEIPSTENKPPLVLISVAGQVAWWDITQIMTNKIQNRRKSKLFTTHLLSPKTNSMMDFNTASETELANSVLNSVSNYSNNPITEWECLWRGKRVKNNTPHKDLLSCIKLVGDEAHQVLIDDKFSKFVTVDQSGMLYVMCVLDNNHNNPTHTNGNGHTS